jgi:hypothetical protein
VSRPSLSVSCFISSFLWIEPWNLAKSSCISVSISAHFSRSVPFYSE